MFPKITPVRPFLAALATAALLTAGCGSSGSSDGGRVVNLDPVALWKSVSTSVQEPARALLGWEWGTFVNSFGPLLLDVRYTLDMQKVTYQSTGADGKQHSMSGLLILPKSIVGSLLGDTPAVPILMYQHGTEAYRSFAPSRYLDHQSRPKDYPEVMVAAAIAATGYAVALVDYEGLGDNLSTQPLVVGGALAQQVIDLLKASRDIIAGTGSPCRWNKQLFLMGYSEGGYVTMTATRELQARYAGEFTVTAAAPLSGPHDLSGSMRGIMLSDNTFKAPYFAPLLLAGYNYAYGAQTNFFSPAYALLPPYNMSMPPLVDGSSQSDMISEAMGMTFSPVKLITPKSVMTPEFIAQLANESSPVVTFLKQNDSYREWVPSVPIRMIHHRNDELVPYANSQIAFDAFSTAGAKMRTSRGPGVELVEETAIISIPTDPVKTVHFSAAFPELSRGWKWLDGFKK